MPKGEEVLWQQTLQVQKDLCNRHICRCIQGCSAEGSAVTIHAGEAAGAESVECALNFQAVRIGHGVRCTENPLVMQELADRGVVLELCPTSNLNTKIYETIGDYPIQQLMNKGIRVTVNTDNNDGF